MRLSRKQFFREVGDRQQQTFFAWLPFRLHSCWVWLEKVTVEQWWDGKKWVNIL